MEVDKFGEVGFDVKCRHY